MLRAAIQIWFCHSVCGKRPPHPHPVHPVHTLSTPCSHPIHTLSTPCPTISIKLAFLVLAALLQRRSAVWLNASGSPIFNAVSEKLGNRFQILTHLGSFCSW